MKPIIKLLPAVLLLFVVALSGCEKEWKTLKMEIWPDSEQTVIEQTADGILFKFCLINEQGEPATVFKEGENFAFGFSVQNQLQNTIMIPTNFVNNNFYRVYRKDNNDMGKPWTGIWCNFSLASQELTVSHNEVRSLNCPWQLTESNRPEYPLCMDESKSVLAKGEYYTFIETPFDYVVNNNKQTIKLNFKINFKIE